MKKHSIYSQDKETTIKEFDKFDSISIKNAIKAHLKTNPNDVIEHYGIKDEIINFYQNNKKNIPCKVILKGNREFLKKLN